MAARAAESRDPHPATIRFAWVSRTAPSSPRVAAVRRSLSRGRCAESARGQRAGRRGPQTARAAPDPTAIAGRAAEHQPAAPLHRGTGPSACRGSRPAPMPRGQRRRDSDAAVAPVGPCRACDDPRPTAAATLRRLRQRRHLDLRRRARVGDLRRELEEDEVAEPDRFGGARSRGAAVDADPPLVVARLARRRRASRRARRRPGAGLEAADAAGRRRRPSQRRAPAPRPEPSRRRPGTSARRPRPGRGRSPG